MIKAIIKALKNVFKDLFCSEYALGNDYKIMIQREKMLDNTKQWEKIQAIAKEIDDNMDKINH